MSLLERIYFFHDELMRDRFPNTRTLMRTFEISLPTARRDIAYLRDRLLAPLAFSTTKNGFYYSEDGFNLPFENSPRIIFLLGMLNKIAEETGLSNLPEIRQLEKRLSSFVSKDYNHLSNHIYCEWVEVEHPEPLIFDTVVEAIVKGRQLTIAYRSLGKERTSRIIEPLKLVNYQGRWYLYAWCSLRASPRLFHLARIIEAQVGTKLQTPVNRGLEFLEHSFGIFKGPPRYQADILFTGTAAELVKNQYWHRDQVVEETAEGVRIRLPVNDDREIMTKILQYGAQAQVLQPPQLAEKIKLEIYRMIDLYSSEEATTSH